MGDELPGLSKSTLTRLARLGIAARFDLVLHLPLRYDDETRLYSLNEAPAGQPVQVEGKSIECDIQYRPRRQLVCHIQDGSGVLTLRFFNFYPSQLKQLAAGARVRAFGEIRHGFYGPEMVHPKYRVVQEGAPVPRALTPVYPTTSGLAQDELRRLIARALVDSDLADTLPGGLIERLRLPAFRDAVLRLHNPPPQTPRAALAGRTHPAWRRVKFDELLAQQLSMQAHYRRRKAAGAPALRPRGKLAQALLSRLPFKLTTAQNKALAQIRHDLAQPHPMQRLLQGDVGSGKTVVAALAALQSVENGRQVAVMAPTEILAEQHYRKFAAWLEPLGIRVAWLSGGLGRKEKRAALAAVAKGEAMIAVGTHALIEEEVEFAGLALAIVDEQHRFGVHQRLALRMKGARPNPGAQPHQLMMSATPIPRTLAMSYYADLDVSVIDEAPPGRTPVTTKLVSAARRGEVIRRVRDACMAGSQAYWVCPLIEESEALQLKTALATHATLVATFPELRLGLVHGRLQTGEKARVMDAFRGGAIQLLVATTVIEVGVDVPNATLMVIEHAERMGLAQLHQLRGRVGRGADAAACILLYANPLTPAARERLKIVYQHQDGFEIARHDLRLRGPGELLGARQSGIPMLRFADLDADLDLLDQARAAAATLLREQPDAARAHLARWFGGRHEFLKV
ncbi:MAG: ATP-dependent DNA helicase RecG [Betaproteobacteria bacterium RIFCSPLOWO2_02_FULL_67_26]|nr:MAG: ATP-dependent DNA helicase RecG [Betaproteobacteria bacterium RIFCSPLOWO2_02_FULL_67_26]